MSDWKTLLNGDPIPWLLETDPEQPAVRYFTLRDILNYTEDTEEIREAKAAIMSSGPVPAILNAQDKEGYWMKPGPGYSPKYHSTIWQIMFLAQLGADGLDARVKTACEYVLNHSISKSGGFSFNGTPSAFVHCLAGNLGAALIDLGYLEDQRLKTALQLQARMITGEGIAAQTTKDTLERYYAYTPGPLFLCGPNRGLSCAWGAIKAMLALGKVPVAHRTETMEQAISQGISFLLSHNPALADYPFGYGDKPSSSWFKFGYPIGYVADVLQNLEVLALLEQINDARVSPALKFLLGKQDDLGRWKMEYSLNSKMWTDIEKKGRPSKWITLRAIRVLKAAHPE
jgi:hypothetical protein